MFNNLQFRQLIIQPVLQAIYLYSQAAEDLLVGTCAQESRGGTYLFQQGTNPDLYASLKKNELAVGIYQMQPATHDDLWDRFLPLTHTTAVGMLVFCGLPYTVRPKASTMLYNLYYATAMARLYYYHTVSEPIPDTLDLQAEYYKKHYNTANGKATIDEYILNYNYFGGTKK